MRRSARWWLLLLALAAGMALGALPALRAFWRARESNPVRRGAALAARVGCLSCHGPDGTRGLPDPRSAAEVPAWDGGVPMMYVNGEQEVREYILDGVSRRRAASRSAEAERARAAIRMPAYREVLSSREVDDLVDYFMAASMMRPIPDAAAASGRDLVRRHRCEACHGVGGAGGVSNPASLKGYVPGWLGRDYDDLVRDEKELREWILDGGSTRLARNSLARYFLTRQRLQMPPYRAAISPEETEAMVAYIRWLRENR